MYENDQSRWADRAACASTDPFYFHPEKGGSALEAKRICAGCDVRIECLTYALETNQQFGVWGGLSERERHKLLRQRRAKEAS
jgi:WhiB family redox-sensing transcriptional regulator